MKKTAFSKRLRAIIEEKNLRQIDLCQKTGIGKSAMSQYLRGSFEPKQQNLHALAEALNVSEAWLMGYDVPRARPPAGSSEYKNDSFLQIPDSFCFTAPDDSMENAHIPQGSIVVIQKQPLEKIPNGKIVHLSLKEKGESCLRFLYQDSDTLFFSAANPAYPPFSCKRSDLTEYRLRITGVARRIIIHL